MFKNINKKKLQNKVIDVIPVFLLSFFVTKP